MGCCSNRYSYEEIMEPFFKKVKLNNKEAAEINNIIVSYGTYDRVYLKINKEELDEDSYLITKQTPNKNKKSHILIKKEKSINILLTDINYQGLIYEYLVIEHYEKEMNNYFYKIYNEIPLKIKYPIIKIILILLFSSPDSSQIETILVDSLSFYNRYSDSNSMNRNSTASVSIYSTDLKSDRLITKENLFTLLKIYFLSISLFSIESFYSSLMKEQLNNEENDYHKEKEFYLNVWKPKIISGFAKEFLDKQKENAVNAFNIEGFVKENYVYLMNSKDIKRDIVEYSLIRGGLEKDEKIKIKYNYNAYRNYNLNLN